MVQFKILAGGFTAFIATYVFDSDRSTLSLTKQNPSGENPSWIAAHPKNASILYAVNEIGPIGNLQSFAVDATGGLTLVDTVATGGNGPTFTNPLSSGEVTAANFGSPNAAFIATDPANPAWFIKDNAASTVGFPAAQGESNPHQTLEHNGEVFVPDLGADKIWRVGKDASGNFKVHGQIDVAPGSGPRHIAIRDNILFTLNEVSSTLTAQPIPQGPNGTALPLIASASIVPTDFAADFFAAEIVISEPSKAFPNPIIYVSNRNVNAQSVDPRGDSIAIFEFTAPTPARRMVRRRVDCPREVTAPAAAAGGSLTLVKQVFTGLQQIRSFAIGKVADGGDEYLVAAGNKAGGVAVFKRMNGGKELALVARNTELESRTSFVFL